MARTWHYSSDGVDTQTLDDKAFAAHCREGKISDETMVWTPGMDQWQSYAELRATEEAAEAVRRAAREKAAAGENDDSIPRFKCDKCGKDWPEALTVKTSLRRLCRLCHSREQEEARAAAELKANRKKNAWWLDTRVIVGFSVVFTVAVGVLVYSYILGRAIWDAPPAQTAEAWASKPRDQWPQIVLASDAQLRGWPQPLHAANTCLVADPHGHVLGLGSTAMFQAAIHASQAGAIPAPGKPMPTDQLLRSLGASLTEWRVGTKAPNLVVFTKIHGQLADYGKSEVVLLEPAAPLTPSPTLPATALKVRTIPVQKDLRVFVVAASPAAPRQKQTIIPGALHATYNGQKVLDLAMNEPVDPPALTGAPVLDEGGHLMGTVNGTLDGPDKNGHFTTLSAESVESFAKPLDLPTEKPGTKAPTKDIKDVKPAGH